MAASNKAAIALAVVALGASAVALPHYPGSALLFAGFALSFTALFVLAVPKPRLYAYTFLVALLGLGLWAKTLVHTFWGLPFLEPTGDFANTAAEWDAAVLAMTAAALGLATVRGLHLWYRHKHPGISSPGTAPTWLSRWRGSVWIATFALLVAVNAANLHFAFFQVGVNPKLLLPLRLHVLLSWLVNIGFALWIAALLWWEQLAAPGSLRRTLVAPMLEATVSSVSSFSRFAYLVHGLPYWLAGWDERARLRLAISRRALAALAACFALFLVAAILAVFWLRLAYYPQVDRSTGLVQNPTIGQQMAFEIPQLALRRWIGLEGILTVGAVPGRGGAALVEAVTDSPKRGADSLFRKATKLQPYLVDPSKFMFHTNAGPVAILFYSGSAWVVLAGMAVISLVLVFGEELIVRFTANPFLAAVAGAALANVVAQTTFFYLTLVFLLQLCAAIAFIALLERIRVSAA